MNSQPSRVDNLFPIVDLPQPETPIKTIAWLIGYYRYEIGIFVLEEFFAGHVPAEHNYLLVLQLDRTLLFSLHRDWADFAFNWSVVNFQRVYIPNSRSFDADIIRYSPEDALGRKARPLFQNHGRE